MNYKDQQKDYQQSLIGSSHVFRGDKGGGEFRGTPYPFVLQEGNHNLYHSIVESALAYMNDNEIAWWGGCAPNGHILSSQIACFNHLFAFKDNKEAVLAIVQNLNSDFVEVLPIACDKDPQYIAFEVVSKNDHLNELTDSRLTLTRGANCTSVDALICARHKDGTRWLIPIEWKYTETYAPEDKSLGRPGETRVRRYHDLIVASSYLKTEKPYGSVYYFEPFYQLMRQTLWSEQMILHKGTEAIQADKFLHLHVIPRENKSLLDKIYRVSGLNMEDTWRRQLLHPEVYRIISPAELLAPVFAHADAETKALQEYLCTRYGHKAGSIN